MLADYTVCLTASKLQNRDPRQMIYLCVLDPPKPKQQQLKGTIERKHGLNTKSPFPAFFATELPDGSTLVSLFAILNMPKQGDRQKRGFDVPFGFSLNLKRESDRQGPQLESPRSRAPTWHRKGFMILKSSAHHQVTHPTASSFYLGLQSARQK